MCKDTHWNSGLLILIRKVQALSHRTMGPSQLLKFCVWGIVDSRSWLHWPQAEETQGRLLSWVSNQSR